MRYMTGREVEGDNDLKPLVHVFIHSSNIYIPLVYMSQKKANEPFLVNFVCNRTIILLKIPKLKSLKTMISASLLPNIY